jgi:hypothetical protein
MRNECHRILVLIAKRNKSLNRERINMKMNRLILALVGGMLAVASAHANQGINLATYRLRYSPAQPTVSQTKTEYQVAVMAQAPAQSADARAQLKQLCPTVSEWFGTSASTHATRSH